MARQLAGIRAAERRRDPRLCEPRVEVDAAPKRPLVVQILASESLDLVARQHDVAERQAGDFQTRERDEWRRVQDGRAAVNRSADGADDLEKRPVARTCDRER